MHFLSLLRQLLITAGFFVAWLWVLGQLIRVVYPEDDTAAVDTYRSASPLVSDAPNIVLYEFDRLRRPADKRMIVIGSSTAMLNLRADHLRPDFSGWDVHNMAIPTSNMDQIYQVLEMVIAVSDEQTLDNTVFILPLYYVMFSDRLYGGKSTPLSVEMMRYGLYRSHEDTTPTPLLGYRLAPVTHALLHVFLGVDKLSKAAAGAKADLVAGKPIDWTRFEPTIRQPYKYAKRPRSDAKAQRSENARRVRQIGLPDTLEHPQFERLEDIADRVLSVGARLVIVDGPVPTWNRRTHFNFYREHKQSFVAGLAQKPGVTYLDFTDLLTDDLFGDSAHTMIKGSEMFEDAVAQAIQGLREPIR